MPIDAWWLYGISQSGLLISGMNCRTMQPDRLLFKSHEFASTELNVGVAPLNGLVGKSARPSYDTSGDAPIWYRIVWCASSCVPWAKKMP